MIIELSRFYVKRRKSKRVDRWMKMLRSRLPEVMRTLKREKMYVEVIFREKAGKEEFLYWFSIQGEGGEHVTTSPFKIDREHIKFSKECIDIRRGKTDLRPQVVMIPARIRTLMK